MVANPLAADRKCPEMTQANMEMATIARDLEVKVLLAQRLNDIQHTF
jgi:hypothetical protein